MCRTWSKAPEDRFSRIVAHISFIHVFSHVFYFTAVAGVGSSPALATCETCQVQLAGVPCGFSRGSPVFANLLIDPSHMSCNNPERDVKLKKQCFLF